MSNKKRIGILGIGGVGGYIGGLLAAKYTGSENIEVIFIVRSASVDLIRNQGLKLITDEQELNIFPSLVSSYPAEIGHLDYLLCCTKTYDLEESLGALNNCIDPGTVILPLYNGVEGAERIMAIYPQAEVLEGCVYIVARREAPGIVKVVGDNRKFYFGSTKYSGPGLEELQGIFKEAGIDSNLSSDIELICWEKFIFISPFASLTTCLDITIEEVLKDETHRETLLKLLSELKAIALAKRIPLPADIIEITIHKMEKIPAGVLSSMHRDSRQGGKTELASLTEYVIMLGRKYTIPTPKYNKTLHGILSKTVYKR